MKPTWTPFNSESGPWLIWSHDYGCWHVNHDGAACGYTGDITRAGVFEEAKAKAYHCPKGGKDFAVPAAQVMDDMDAALSQAEGEVRTAAARLQRLRVRLSMPPTTPPDSEPWPMATLRSFESRGV